MGCILDKEKAAVFPQKDLKISEKSGKSEAEDGFRAKLIREERINSIWDVFDKVKVLG